jgi:lipopolysaccharide/colanic/teichoic acid biosynthesis glycosyltransferase
MKDSRPPATQPAAPPPPTPPWPDVDDVPPSSTVYLSAPAGWYATLKPTFDLIAAAVLVVLLFPFMVVAWLAIKLTSPGPGVYAQTRSGRGGRLFRILKIRSMHHTPATAADYAWAKAGDARITRVGKVLRALHLDELPQLVNVLRGEMSLVGPRPERPEVIAGKGLGDEVPGYTLRGLVRPGVTGLAQVQLPADSDITSVKHKLYYDLYYLSHQTVWLDLRICVGTLLKCVMRPERLRKLLFLPTREQVCDHFLSLLAVPAGEESTLVVPVA